MCWQCEHPDQGHEGALRHMRGLIDTHGWSVQGVEADRVYPDWAYTVGLTPYRLPELVVTGLPLGVCAELLNLAAAEALAGTVPEPGDRLDLGTGAPFESVELDSPWAHLHTAVELYGPAVRAIQLVYPDERGRWPWDREFRDGAGGQPVLGSSARP